MIYEKPELPSYCSYQVFITPETIEITDMELGGTEHRFFSIDPMVQPKTWRMRLGSVEATGIYAIEEDRLKIAFGTSAGQLPRSFSANDETVGCLMVLRRPPVLYSH